MLRFNNTSEQKTRLDNDESSTAGLPEASTAGGRFPLPEASTAGGRFPLPEASTAGGRFPLHARHQDSGLNTRQSGSMSAVPSPASYDMEDDDLEPSRPIQVVHSSPQINLKSILKRHLIPAQRAEASVDMFRTHGDGHDKKVKWVPEVDVFYYAGDAAATHAKEALCEELDQHARKAEFAGGYNRVGVSTVDRRPFLDTPWPSADFAHHM